MAVFLLHYFLDDSESEDASITYTTRKSQYRDWASEELKYGRGFSDCGVCLFFNLRDENNGFQFTSHLVEHLTYFFFCIITIVRWDGLHDMCIQVAYLWHRDRPSTSVGPSLARDVVGSIPSRTQLQVPLLGIEHRDEQTHTATSHPRSLLTIIDVERKTIKERAHHEYIYSRETIFS